MRPLTKLLLPLLIKVFIAVSLPALAAPSCSCAPGRFDSLVVNVPYDFTRKHAYHLQLVAQSKPNHSAQHGHRSPHCDWWRCSIALIRIVDTFRPDAGHHRNSMQVPHAEFSAAKRGRL